ncbi:hypothetical protein [Paenibacillus popilliae]|uniref:Lipoprotein n=1 Tax=Paenibacillus popilliae TaxID=78057 RepID=A0ABY3AYN8_PAEPP|nr:hypothetical protein [Paenibacillus sp. SDF0028]TQR46340.1 hypothetical protein C7Y44_01210 [Paenibacillus sp. SDF0028]
MKRITVILLFLFTIFVIVVGCERTKVSNNDNESSTTYAKANTIPLTDNEVKNVLNGLIPKAVTIYGIFNGNGAFKSDATKTIPGEKDYCLITGQNGEPPINLSNVKSIVSLKKVVEDVFTADIAQELFYSRYLGIDPRPLYKDYEGQLYVDTQNGGHGWAEKYLIDTAKLKGQKDNVAEIELEKTTLDAPPEKITLSIQYVNDKWLMASPLVP